MKLETIICALFFSVILQNSTSAETRMWTLTDGQTVEAELMSVVGNKVVLKMARGKVVKFASDRFSADDRSYIALATPPELEIQFTKNSKMRRFPDSLSELPSSAYYNFTAVIQKKSAEEYNYDLTAELFVIGREKIGPKHTLLDYQKETIRFENESGSICKISSRTVELMQFVMNEQLLGEEYAGYMIVVTDSRGEIISYVTKRDEWFRHIDKLRNLPVGKYFDNECNRCFTTPPKRWY